MPGVVAGQPGPPLAGVMEQNLQVDGGAVPKFAGAGRGPGADISGSMERRRVQLRPCRQAPKPEKPGLLGRARAVDEEIAPTIVIATSLKQIEESKPILPSHF